jgi:multidrug efflux pump subunit AcrB
MLWLTRAGPHSLAELRSFQDWNLRYALQSVPGVAEVATVGGFQNQYQVNVDRDKLRAYNIPIMEATEAVRNANIESGGRSNFPAAPSCRYLSNSGRWRKNFRQPAGGCCLCRTTGKFVGANAR